MALNIRISCPFCGHMERMPVHWPPLMMKDTANLPTSDHHQARKASTAVVCVSCLIPFGVVISTQSHRIQNINSLVNGPSADLDTLLRKFTVRTRPKSMHIEQIAGLPEAIQQPFQDAQEDVGKRRASAAVMSTLRGCLDVVLKEKGATGRTRRERIESLRDKGIITEDLAKWSQKLWEDGNDAVHDLTASPELAKEHMEFLRLLFSLIYRLPHEIEQWSGSSETNGENSDEIEIA